MAKKTIQKQIAEKTFKRKMFQNDSVQGTKHKYRVPKPKVNAAGKPLIDENKVRVVNRKTAVTIKIGIDQDEERFPADEKLPMKKKYDSKGRYVKHDNITRAISKKPMGTTDTKKLIEKRLKLKNNDK